MILAAIELLGALISVVALAWAGSAWPLRGVAREVRPVVMTLLLCSLTAHLCDMLEGIGFPWWDRVGDAFGTFRPALWGFLLYALGRAALTQRLHVQDQQLRFFFEQTPAAVAVLDRQGRYVAASLRWRQSFHADPSQAAEGRSLSALAPDLGPLVAFIQDAMASTRQPQAQQDPMPLLLHGEVAWVRWSARPWTQDAGPSGTLSAPDGVVVMVEVVTEEVAAEERLREQQQALLLSSRLETVGVVAGGVAHDIRNFLMVISSNASLLEASSRGKEALEEAHEASQGIQEAVLAASDILETLTRMSRRDRALPVSIDLGECMTQTEALLKHFLPRNIQLSVLTPRKHIVTVRAAQTQLQQVFLNLAINARDAMPSGGRLVLTLSFAAAHGGAHAGAYAEVAVSDTGAGISPEVGARLFEPLFTTKAEGQGTGLGLAIVASVLQDFGGEISYSSEVGMGTTFLIKLPCHVTARCDATDLPDRAHAASVM